MSNNEAVSRHFGKRFFWIAVGFLALFVTGFLLLPIFDPVSDRQRSSEMFVSGVVAKEAVGKTLLAQGRLDEGEASRIEAAISDGYTSYRDVDASGQITLFSEELGILLVFEPVIEGETVKWSCHGFPARSVPAPCRD